MNDGYGKQAGLKRSRPQIGGGLGVYWLTLFAALLVTRTLALAAKAPYPRSPLIEGITWHVDTHRTDAGGSDLWPTTWAADGHIYTSWGDGAGFGSDFPEEGGHDRVSMWSITEH